MRSTSSHKKHAEQMPRGARERRSLGAKWATAVAALVGVAVLGAGCGGSNGPGVAGSSSNKGNHTSASTSSPGGMMTQAVAYARCMRSHGVSDFPDPTPSQGGGVAFQISGGSGSDLNHNNPRFRAADHACRSLLAGGVEPPAPSAQKIAAEVEWARCMRSHGLPSFPDPNAQGALDSSRFDDTSPAFQTASHACASLEPTGPMAAVPGHGSGP